MVDDLHKSQGENGSNSNFGPKVNFELDKNKYWNDHAKNVSDCPKDLKSS